MPAINVRTAIVLTFQAQEIMDMTLAIPERL